jgi:hypothetical protein
MKEPPCSPDLALNDFWLFPEIQEALKGRRFRNTEYMKKKYLTKALKAVPQ